MRMAKAEKVFLMFVLFTLISSIISYAQVEDFTVTVSDQQPLHKPNFFQKIFRYLFQEQSIIGLRSSYNAGDSVDITSGIEFDDTCEGRVDLYVNLKHGTKTVESKINILSQSGSTMTPQSRQISVHFRLSNDVQSGSYSISQQVICIDENRRYANLIGGNPQTKSFTVVGSSGNGGGSGGGGGGGSGGGGSCTEQWDCTGFGACNNGIQTQTCSDRNNCGTTNNRPLLQQSCSNGGGNGCTQDVVTPCPNGSSITTQKCEGGQLIPTGLQCQPVGGCTEDVKLPCQDGSEVIVQKCANNQLVATNLQCSSQSSFTEYYNNHKTVVWVAGVVLVILGLVIMNKNQNG